ncbi:MAG TPA: UDP-3-O-acyl-N-acetylglucosamine deacetylase, partial [Fimbriimonadaceae bacterium]|nr:UDP-3-O-acyl-N-acetylglucosamine deacetylase [Fimbriimonadaceae bacterium]
MPVHLRLAPAREGIRFFDGQSWVKAAPENVTDTIRSTRLGEIGTVEHLMSALAGCEITDLDVLVDGGELPALDGAAQTYVAQIMAAGFESVGSLEVTGPFARVFTHESESSVAVAKGAGHWTYRFVNEARWPFRQEVEFLDIVSAYAAE